MIARIRASFITTRNRLTTPGRLAPENEESPDAEETPAHCVLEGENDALKCDDLANGLLWVRRPPVCDE